MSRLVLLLLLCALLATSISLTAAQNNNDVLRVRRAKPSLNRPVPVRRATKGVDNPFEMPDDEDEQPEHGQPAPVCPVSLSDSFDIIRAINNFRITHSLSAINISRSLMSTACAHMRDITVSDGSINNDCGLHSWSSCCYPSDHTNPNCMHRKALQVTTALKWNVYNVAAYELAYEWAGGPFSAIRALDMFVANPDHKKFLLQEDSWSQFKWRAVGASVGDRYAYIWFGTLLDPNGDFDQFNVDSHVMELPGCACTGTPITWKPTPTLSPDQQAELERKQKLEAVPSLYATEDGQDDALLASLLNSTSKATDATADSSTATNSSSNGTESSAASEDSKSVPQDTVKTESGQNETALSSSNNSSSGNISDSSERPTTTSLLHAKETGNATSNSSALPGVSVQDPKPSVQDPKPTDNVKQISISLTDFLKGLTQG